MVIKERCQILLGFLLWTLLVGRPSLSQKDRLQQGQLLKDGEELHSAYGYFRLGFFSPDGTTRRYLGIWYHKPKSRDYKAYVYGYGSYQQEEKIQPVWVANRNTPISDKSGRLTVDSKDGNLKILHSGKDPIVISSIQAAGNTTASLDKSGNFVLYEMNSDGSMRRELWQSFDYPTDTLLPGMKLGINLQTGHKWFLQSWMTYKSPASGLYTLALHANDKKRLAITGSLMEHNWTSGVWLNGVFNSSFSAYRYDYNFSYTSNEQEIYFNYSVNEDVTSFPSLKLSPYGGLWTDDESTYRVKCSIFGGCDEDNFCPLYWDSFQVNYGFMAVEGLKFRGSENVTHGECRAECFRVCCFAYAITTDRNDKGSCEIWRKPTKFIESYRDGRKLFIASTPDEFPWLVIGLAGALGVAFLFALFYRIRRKCKAKEEKWWESLIFALIIPLLFHVCYLMGRKLKARVESISNRRRLLHELEGRDVPVSLPMTIFGKGKSQAKCQSSKHDLKIFDFQVIAAATNNFSTENKLGQGGFGPVYKGRLLDGREIAIKKLSKSSGQGIVEFANEAKLIAKLQHTNLVKLLGCSLHGTERILIYEYMPNRSLDFFLFDSNRKNLLNLKKCLSIIEGIAQGLIYLHKYSRLKVIHRDLKVSNILLDNQMNPKISDFGLARAFGVDELEANTKRIVGTHGYMSPEYVMNGVVSMKTDVYSFGVMVLEIVSSKKNNSSYDTERPLNLVGYAWQLWNEGRGLELIDQRDESCSQNEALRCLHVGLLCVQDRATDRPTMSEVISMLTNETVILPAPKQPAFFISIASDQEPEVIENKLENCSANNVTISEMEAR